MAGWACDWQVCSDLGQVKWRQISSQLWEQAPMTLFQKLAWFTIKIMGKMLKKMLKKCWDMLIMGTLKS